MAVSENADAAAMFWEVGAPPIIAVIRASTDDASRVAAAVETLAGAGIRSIELTLTTPKALELVAPLKQRLGPAVKVGMGTLWSEDDAASAVAVGADYLVTPAVVPGALTAARGRLPILCGAWTPTEVHQACAGGAGAVKLFPAVDSVTAIAHMRSLFGPMPGVRIIPSGGVTVAGLGAWLEGGALGVSLGSDLMRDGLSVGGLDGLARRAREAVAQAGGAT